MTQNVDRLHQKAGSERVTDLHGTAFTVSCVACKRFRTTRHRLQQSLTTLNEGFHEENLGELRPDGDVTLSDEQVGSFRPPICPQCHDGGIIKPEIVFFGENVARERVEAIQRTVKSADAALVLGSSLSVRARASMVSLVWWCATPGTVGSPKTHSVSALKVPENYDDGGGGVEIFIIIHVFSEFAEIRKNKW